VSPVCVKNCNTAGFFTLNSFLCVSRMVHHQPVGIFGLYMGQYESISVQRWCSSPITFLFLPLFFLHTQPLMGDHRHRSFSQALTHTHTHTHTHTASEQPHACERVSLLATVGEELEREGHTVREVAMHSSTIHRLYKDTFKPSSLGL
jgi:hypothetical protein